MYLGTGWVALPGKDQVHSLRVLLDLALLLEKQLPDMARNVFCQLQLVRQLQPFLDKKDLAHLSDIESRLL